MQTRWKEFYQAAHTPFQLCSVLDALTCLSFVSVASPATLLFLLLIFIHLGFCEFRDLFRKEGFLFVSHGPQSDIVARQGLHLRDLAIRSIKAVRRDNVHDQKGGCECGVKMVHSILLESSLSLYGCSRGTHKSGVRQTSVIPLIENHQHI